jgi:hypothetical protein
VQDCSLSARLLWELTLRELKLAPIARDEHGYLSLDPVDGNRQYTRHGTLTVTGVAIMSEASA